MHHKYPFITGRVTIQHFHERRIDKYLPIINPPRAEKKGGRGNRKSSQRTSKVK